MAIQLAAWRLVPALTVAVGVALGAVGPQFTSFNDRTRAVLEGNWQSCREPDGQYAERIFDSRLPDIGPFELHMGPYHEFALFKGVQDEHRDHDSKANLLRPFTVEVNGAFGKHKWDVAGLHLEVALAGGSREDCESWFVTLTRSTESSSH